jgi:hypothetical protein
MIWPFKKKKYERCPHCGFIVGHTPSCIGYKECSHEWTRYYTSYLSDLAVTSTESIGPTYNRIMVCICRKCYSSRIFDRKDAQGFNRLSGRKI